MFGRRGYGRSTTLGGFIDNGYPRQESLVEEMLEVEAIEDLMEGDIGGFVEDEILADIF